MNNKKAAWHECQHKKDNLKIHLFGMAALKKQYQLFLVVIFSKICSYARARESEMLINRLEKKIRQLNEPSRGG